jgi:hypothetical protein
MNDIIFIIHSGISVYFHSWFHFPFGIMNPWVLLDQVEVPGDGGEMKLYQRAFEFSISAKNEELTV